MTLVITVLEAQVPPESEPRLTSAYRDAVRDATPPGLLRSSLMRSTADTSAWRIETTWASGDALMAMRSSGGTPRGIQIFRAAGVEPTLTILEVVDELPSRAGAT